MLIKKMFAFVFVAVFLLLPAGQASASDPVPVQISRNMTIDGSSSTLLPEMKHAQTFKVNLSNYNVISSVDIAVNNLSPGKINIKLYPVGSATSFGDLTVTNTKTIPGTSWFTFKPRSVFHLPMNGTDSFVMVVAYTSNTETGWVSSNFTDPYPNGSQAQATGDGGKNLFLIDGADHGFIAHGYFEAPAAEQPAEISPAQPQTVTSTTGTSTVAPSNAATEANTVVASSDTSKNASVKTIDSSLTPPTLDAVAVNDEVVEVSTESEIIVKNSDVLKISGKAPAGSSVAIFIGSDNAFTTMADSDGNYAIEISLTDIAPGSYKVSAQVQDSLSGKGSEIADFFTISLSADSAELEDAVSTAKPSSFWDKVTGEYVVYTYLVATIIILLLLWLLLVLRSKRIEGVITKKSNNSTV